MSGTCGLCAMSSTGQGETQKGANKLGEWDCCKVGGDNPAR